MKYQKLMGIFWHQKAIIILYVFCIGYGQVSNSDSTSSNKKIIGYDKIQHTAVSCLLTLSSQYILEEKSNYSQNGAIGYSVSTSTMIGLAKELNDMNVRKKPFDWGDMIANFVGIGMAVLIVTI